MAEQRHSRMTQFPADLEARIFKIAEGESNQGDLAKSIRKLHLGAGSVVGDDFFPALAAQLSELTGADLVVVGRILPGGEQVQTLAVTLNGDGADNLVYDLKGTPCEVTISRASCIYPQGVAVAFPEDEILVEQGAEGYTGVALFDSKGKAIGVIATLFFTPIADPEFQSTLLLSVAPRAAAEVERQISDENRRQLDANILASQKLESLGVLAGGLAHDFNNILATILGSADLASCVLADDAPAQKRLEVIRTASTSAGELCRQLLAYAGKGKFQVVHADLNDLVQGQQEFLRSSVGKGVRIKFDLSKNIPTCEADLSQLRQILLNLVINASEALKGNKGVIEVSIGKTTLERPGMDFVEIAQHCEPGEYVYLDVFDTGVGMEAEVKAKLFDPFFTTKATGRGLGLSAILGIVRGHHGQISVRSKPGAGSRFTVYFPVSEGASSPASHSLGLTDVEWRGSGTALLVDDDLSILDVSGEMLRHIGFEVIAVDGGAEAVEIFRERNRELSIVVLDLTMPGLTGDQVFSQMRAINPAIPVVLSSGYNEQDTVQKFAGSGLAGFLQKPMSLSEMRHKIRLAIESKA
jgi:two-component system, cell cycle sensor histidine kinase and response regulator CckA